MQRSDSTHHGVSGKVDCTGLAVFAREIGLLQVGNWSENLGRKNLRVFGGLVRVAWRVHRRFSQLRDRVPFGVLVSERENE